jgi:mannose-P-dolichol utilization defect protein 1
LIGLAIIAGAVILKVPQIKKIVDRGSVQGISKSLFYLETLNLLQTAALSMKANIPFSVYGETLIIMAQNIIIILLFWNYDKSIGNIEKLVLFTFFSGYSYLLF